MKSAKYYKGDILPNKMKIDSVRSMDNGFQYSLSDGNKTITVNEGHIDNLMNEYYNNKFKAE